jgi:bifunctional non-homologous end joining protein LigD
MVAISNLTGLISLMQASVVEMHPWGSTINRLEQPDRLIFDLDPGDNVPWPAVIEAAYDVRGRHAAVGLQSMSRRATRCCSANGRSPRSRSTGRTSSS